MSSESTTRPAPADQPVRDRIRRELDGTLVVEAAAGTGKTTALVERIVEVVRQGKGELAGIVAVTFTEKAAGELKLRIRGELESARRAAASDRASLERLEKGLAQLEEAHIGTIHGFCADLLRERPLAAGVDPLFEVATDEETDRIYRAAFDRWLENVLADPPPGVRRLLREPQQNDLGPVDRLYRAGLDLAERRDFATPWEIRPFDREARIDAVVERALDLAARSEAATSDRDYLYRDLEPLRAFAREVERQERITGERDYDRLEHALRGLRLGRRKGRGPYGPGVARDELLEERDALDKEIRELSRDAGADLAARLWGELQDLVAAYQRLKERAGRLDFLDLLLRARDLLVRHADVRRELQERFTHIFVDEFQDTDPLQAEILLLLAADDPAESDWRRVRPVPGKLFVVADPKQSIYRFRRADVALYERVKRSLLEAGAELVHLSVSFRSVPEIQKLVNAAMEPVMTGDEASHQAAYVPLEPYRGPLADQPAIVALPVPRPYGSWGRITQYAIKRSEPEAIAAWLEWLFEESRFVVTSRDEGGAPRPVGPSDVCLLFRRFMSGREDITRPYVDALQARDIPHRLVGGRGFHQREEIDAMRAALGAVERPDDELAVFATLRGPLFAFEDEPLLVFRERHGSLHPFRAPREPLDESERPIAEALETLARLHRARNVRPVAQTIRELLDATRAQAGFALWQAGDQVLANVLRLVQLARNFESSGGISFRGFVEHLERLAEEGESVEQPLVEEGAEGVRLMTVHRAKGLEFPVVVLCDVACRIGKKASRHVDPERRLFAVRLAGRAPWELLDHEEIEALREEAESERLLYVAATRARDLLAVAAVADEADRESWLRSLHPTLYPPVETQRLAEVAPGCPPFRGDTVVERPADAYVPPGEGIRPGLHRPRVGEHRVVWWDATLLDGPPGAAKPGIRRHTILEAHEGPVQEETRREHEAWQERRRRLVEAAARPSLDVETATARAERTEGAPVSIAVELVERDPTRPTGARFGTLVHELLARIDLGADRDAARRLAESLGRTLGSSGEEVDAAVEAVLRALAHPILRRAAAAAEGGVLYREAPVAHRAEDGVLVEGVVDLAFRDPDGEEWTVVDFKTDVRPDIGQDVYRRQVALYVEAVRAATGAATRGVLLYV